MAYVKKGIRWYYTVELRVDGKRRQKWVGGFRTRKEAKDAEANERTKRNRGEWVERSKLTFGDYLEKDWLPRIVKPNVEFSTYDSYATNVRNHIVPALGDIELQKLSADDLIDFYAELRAKGLRSKTVHYIHTIIHKALKDAWDREIVSRNIAAKGTVKPKVRKDDRRKYKPWDREQLRTFLTTGRDIRYYLPWLVGMLTGLRRGEVLGLRWGAIDLATGTATVNHQIVVVRNRAYPKDVLKSNESEAAVPLPRALLAELKAHRARVQENRMAQGLGPVPDDQYIFTDEDGKFLNPETVSQAFERAGSRLGLPRMPLHGLRKSYLSAGKQAGVHPKVLQANARHASITTTMDTYAFVFENEQREAQERIAEFILP